MSVVIVPITDKGTEALEKHLKERKRLKGAKKLLYGRIILEEKEGDNLRLSFRDNRLNMLVRSDDLTNNIKNVMKQNGAIFEEDYIIKVENWEPKKII